MGGNTLSDRFKTPLQRWIRDKLLQLDAALNSTGEPEVQTLPASQPSPPPPSNQPQERAVTSAATSTETVLKKEAEGQHSQPCCSTSQKGEPSEIRKLRKTRDDESTYSFVPVAEVLSITKRKHRGRRVAENSKKKGAVQYYLKNGKPVDVHSSEYKKLGSPKVYTARELHRRAQIQASRAMKRTRPMCFCPCGCGFKKYDRIDLFAKRSGEVRLDPNCKSNEKVFDYTDHDSYSMPDDPKVHPYTVLIEEMCYLMGHFNKGLRQAVDILTLPYSHSGEVLSRLKGTFWLLARGMKILKPKKELESLQTANTLFKQCEILKAETLSFISECRIALKPLKVISKQMQRRKKVFKTLDHKLNLLLFDEEEVDVYVPPIYDNTKAPAEPMVWENYPVIDEPPIGHIVLWEKNNMPTFTHRRRESFDLLWLPSDDCFYRAAKTDVWFAFNDLSLDVKINVFQNLVTTATNLFKTSKNHVFSSIRDFTQVSPGQDEDGPMYIFELLEHAEYRAPEFLTISLPKVDGLKMFRLQRTMQDFFRLKGEYFRIMRLLDNSFAWLESNVHMASTLCTLDGKAWDKIVKKEAKQGCCAKEKEHYFASYFYFVNARIPMDEKLQQDLFANTNAAENANAYVMPHFTGSERTMIRASHRRQ